MIESNRLILRQERRATSIASEVVEQDGELAAAGFAKRLDALFLLNSLDVGGSERKIVRLANRLSARNIDVAIASLNGPDTLALMLDPSVERWRLERRGKLSLRAVKTLTDIVRRRRPRVLFTVNLYPALYATMMSAVLGDTSPAIVGLINTTDLGPRERWRQHFYRHVLNRLDWLVYGCELQRNAWGSLSNRLRSRAQVIYNGVDLEEFRLEALPADRDALRRQHGYSSDVFVIGTVGRLAPAKNQQVLIASLAKLRSRGIDARLVIVGDGPLRELLERQAAQQGVIDAVTFAGALQDVRPILALLDVFVLPSLYIETFSNAALEAMAMGVPVVQSRIGGAAEMIRDGQEGALIEPHDLDERLPAVLTELAESRSRRLEMGMRARARVERDFAFQTMVEQYASLVRRFSA